MDEDIPDSIPRRSHSAANRDEPPRPLQKRKEAPEHCNERGLTEDISTKGPLTITRKEPAHHNYRPPTSKAELERSSHTAARDIPPPQLKTSLILKRSSPAHHNYKATPNQQVERSPQPQLERSPPPKLKRSPLLHLNRIRCIILEQPQGPTTN